ncbi:MAG: serine/threonine protein kinase [Eubacterium sp.]|nr:serine/threonine protein kinase [Eubacterium sp.]
MSNSIPTENIQNKYSQYIDGIPFKLKAPFDFGFIGRYGKVFKVFDDQDSGNICFGTEKNGQKFFVKFAGAPTKEYNGTAEEAIKRLKSTLPIYEHLKHKNLIEFVSAEEIGGGFAMVFKWADGDCAGRQYPEAHRKFAALPNEAKLKVFSDVLEFLAHINSQGYVAVDFYDGSILCDYESGKTTVCDIDLFQKKPYINDMGRMWGSAKFMSPEEFERGAVIDKITNVYTAGAFAFALFGRYERNFEKWSLSKELFDVALKAVSDNRDERQQSIKQFIEEWEAAIVF